MVWVTAAPQSPPWATNLVYPRRFISMTQVRAMRAGSQPVVVGLAENPWPGNEGITQMERIRRACTVCRRVGSSRLARL